MSEKHLTELPWKTLTIKQGVKDLGLQKALVAYSKIDPGKDSARALECLAEVTELATKIKKANQANKEVAGYLDEVLKEVKKTTPTLAATAKAAAAKPPTPKPEQEENEAEDEEQESADIKVRLSNALKKVKAADGNASLAFVACVAKPCYGLLLAKSASEKIGPTHKKTLTDLTSGTKFIVGSCRWENNAHTFIVEVVPAGLAKNLKRSIKEYTGVNWKVRVRDPESKTVSDGDTDTDGEETQPTQTESETTAPTPGADDMGKFTARFKALQPEILKAIAAKTPQGDEIKQRATEAGGFAAKKDFASANRVLDAVEALLKTISGKVASTSATETKAAPTGSANDPKPSGAPKPSGTTPPSTPTPPTETKPGSPPTAAEKTGNKDLDDANAELEATEKLIEDLKKHLQNAHIAGEIAAATTELNKAKEFVKAAKYVEARAAIVEAKKKITAGKDAADKYAEYVKKRAAASVLIHSWTGYDDDFDKTLKDLKAKLKEADGEAAPAKRDFVKAAGIVEAVRKRLADRFQKFYVDDVKPEIEKLKAKTALSFVSADLKEIETLHAEVAANVGKEEWRKVLLSGARVDELIATAIKLADRRKNYDDQRVATRKAIDALKAHASLLVQVANMDKLVAQADLMADRKTMRLEDGVLELQKIAALSVELLKTGADADAYATERTAASDKLAALSKHPNADSVNDGILALKKQLDRAGQLAASGDWKAARATLVEMTKDLATALQIAEKAKELSGVATGKGDAAAVKDAIAKLRKEADALAKGKDADLVKADLAQVAAALKKAEAQASAKPPGNAAADLKTAADLLTKANGAKLQHTRFLERRKAVDDRYQAVLKLPTAKANKAKIQPVEKALKDADAQDKARDWTKATAAIELGEAAVKEAEEMDRLRKAFETRVKDLEKKIKALDKSVDKKRRKEIDDNFSAAGKQAEKFEFFPANRSLDNVEIGMEALDTDKLARKTPLDAALLTASAKKIMAKGGGKALDDLVKQLPDNVPFDALKSLAKERFGLELKSDAGDATKSGKKMWEMLAKVPQDVIGNPSLKTVERREPGKNGGFYQSSGDLVVMNGRPGQSAQGFGKSIADELPKDVEPDCKPVDDKPVDYFDFATLHEVGHSVDDNTQYMQSREGQETFGGWRTYGGKVEPIAEAVAKWAGYNTTPEQKKYVLDLILGNKAKPPVPAPDKKAAADKAQKKVDDWHQLASLGKIWWSNSNSSKVAIDGVVYQEAYPRTWVSYLFKARSQAITGYQFRAPGEWFAELYASYRIGKLKKTHPAVKWLSAIKI